MHDGTAPVIGFSRQAVAQSAIQGQAIAFGIAPRRFDAGNRNANQDVVTIQGETNEPAKKLSWKSAFKHFVSGVFRPITQLVERPLLGAALVLGTLALTALVPVLVPMMVAGGLVFSALQMGRGAVHAVSYANKGQYAEAENAFEDIGSGAFGLVSSSLGLKKAAAEVLKVSKGMAAVEAAEVVAGMSQYERVKTCVNLFGTKEGLVGLLRGLQAPVQFMVDNKDLLMSALSLKCPWSAKPVELVLSGLMRLMGSVLDAPVTKPVTSHPLYLGQQSGQDDNTQGGWGYPFRQGGGIPPFSLN